MDFSNTYVRVPYTYIHTKIIHYIYNIIDTHKSKSDYMANTTLTLDDDAVKKFKEKGINISQFVRESMQNLLEDDTDILEKADLAIDTLKRAQQECIDAIKKLEKRKFEHIQELKGRSEKLINKCKDIPEIQNLQQPYLGNSKKMMALVAVLRDKDPDLRISVAEIREYNQL